MKFSRGFWILAVIAFLASVAVSQSSYFGSRGSRHAKRDGKYQEPKLIIDTVTLSDGLGFLQFVERSDREKHRTSPLDSFNIFTVVSGIMADTSDTVYHYGTWFDFKELKLWVKSNDATDSSKVVVMSLIK